MKQHGGIRYKFANSMFCFCLFSRRWNSQTCTIVPATRMLFSIRKMFALHAIELCVWRTWTTRSRFTCFRMYFWLSLNYRLNKSSTNNQFICLLHGAKMLWASRCCRRMSAFIMSSGSGESWLHGNRHVSDATMYIRWSRVLYRNPAYIQLISKATRGGWKLTM